MPNQRTASGFSEHNAEFVLSGEPEFAITDETGLVSREDSAHEVPIRTSGSKSSRSAPSNSRNSSVATRGTGPGSSLANRHPNRKRISGLALPEEFFGAAPPRIKPPTGSTSAPVEDDDDFELDPKTASRSASITPDAARPAKAQQQAIAQPLPAVSQAAVTPAAKPHVSVAPMPPAAAPPAVSAPRPVVQASPVIPVIAAEASATSNAEAAPTTVAGRPDPQPLPPATEVLRSSPGLAPVPEPVKATERNIVAEPAPSPPRSAVKGPVAAPKKPVYAPRKPIDVRREGRSLRIFVSTTIDVAEERVLARKVLERLVPMFSDMVDVELAFWEHEPLLEMDTFLNERFSPEDADVVICILGSRLGYRMPREELESGCEPYPSGTEYECASAVPGIEDGFRELLVYRKTSPLVVDKLDEFQVLKLFAERKALDRFVNNWFLDAKARFPKAFRPFQDAGDFVDTLQSDLADTIGRIIAQRQLEPRESDEGPARWWKQGSPFLGLSPFGFQHAPLYLIQTRAAEDVLQLLRKQAADGRAFVLVVGAAGCGKSSFVSAGVLPLLTEPGVIEGVGLWRRADFSPCDAPHDMLEGLAATLSHANVLPELAVDGLTSAKLAQLLEKNPPAVGRLIQAALARTMADLRPAPGVLETPQARLVLVVDGLEQLFVSDTVTEEQRRSLISALAALARSGGVWVLATVRSEFYPRCQEYPDLLAVKEGNGHYDMQLPSPADIEKMVRMRAEAAGLAVEKNPRTGVWLDDELCDAASVDRARLYRLEFMLALLFECRNAQNVLPYSAYDDFGRLGQVITTRVENAYESLSAGARAALPGVLEQLASTGPAGPSVGRAVPLDRLRATPAERELADTLLNAGLFSVRRPVAGAITVRMVDEVWKACQALHVSTQTETASEHVVEHAADLHADSVFDFPETVPAARPSEVRKSAPETVPAPVPLPAASETAENILDETLITTVSSAAVSSAAVEPASEAPVAAPSTALALAAEVASTDIELLCGNCHGRLRVETPGTIVICPHCSIPLQTPTVGKLTLPEPHVPAPHKSPSRFRIRTVAAVSVAFLLLGGLSYQYLMSDGEPVPGGRTTSPVVTSQPAEPSVQAGDGTPPLDTTGNTAVSSPPAAAELPPRSDDPVATPTPAAPDRQVAIATASGSKNPVQTPPATGNASLPSAPGLNGDQFINSIEMQFRRIPAGEFVMGSPVSEADRSDEEQPHPVRITRPYYLGSCEVTQAQFQLVMNKNPSSFKGRTLPVESVTWQDASEFCRKLSELPAEKSAGRMYRLPTEAEWEYACRAGSTTAFPQGDALSSQQENFDGKHPYGGAPEGPDLAGTARVGSYPANAFGLHDMPGNVSEWCADFFDRDYYQKAVVDDPSGPTTGVRRVTRGGNWLNGAQRCRSAARGSELPRSSDSVIGFRVVVYTP